MAPHLVIHGTPSARRFGGPGECDCLAVLPPTRSPARASALARTTSGSRRSGGRTSCQGRSRRTLCRWIRIRCTVPHLPGQPPIPGGLWRQPGPVGPALWNDKDCRPRGASPEGADRVEYRCAAIPHPKVLPGRLGPAPGDQAQVACTGYGLGAVGSAKLAQDVAHVRFDRVERHHQVAGDALVGPARGEQPQHRQFAAGQRLGQARLRARCLPGRRRARARLTAQPRGSPAAPAPPVTASRLSQPACR